MQPLFSFRQLSERRSELMGLSILWIMMLHFTFTQMKPLGFVSQYGFAGVEIFVFLSGFGLYRSLEKSPGILRFYHRRLLRIFPTYYLVGIAASLLLFHDNLLTYIFRYSTLGFWTGGPYWEWYVPSIVALYLLAPLLKRVVDANRYAVAVLSAVVLLSAWCLIDNESLLPRSHFFFLYRIPAFLLGLTCGYWHLHNTSLRYFWGILVAGLPLFCLLYPYHHEVYNYKYFSVLFLLPLFIVVLTQLSDRLPWLSSLTRHMGVASFEIYLIQGLFFSSILEGLLVVPSAWHDLFSILFIITSTLLGLAVHKFIDHFIIHRLFSR